MPCAENTYIIGSTLRVEGIVKVDGTPTDPDSISAVVIPAVGMPETLTVDTDFGGTGEYATSHTPSPTDQIGRWRIRIIASAGGETEVRDVVFNVTA